MPIDFIEYKNKKYPLFQAEGFAAQFAIPYAKKICKGIGYDIGCMKKNWAFPGSIPIDVSFNEGYDALNLPQKNVDYIFSSHMLEHSVDWIVVLDYWTEILKKGGTLFLYLPDYSQEYWRPWNNRKHKHVFTPTIIKDYMSDKYINIYNSERDLNDSFMIFGEKNE
jgi:predicted SAM-dependent methyltransferase